MSSVGEASGPAERSDPAVRVEDLRVEYGSTTALDGVDVTVEEGEFFTLVGPSGCGKTTTLRCLAGFEEPTAGSIHIAGESMAGVPPESRGIGVVFQSYALFPHMSVGENVAYGLRFSGPPEGTTKHERVEELLELVDLPGFADRDPDTLSGGQQQRVALARALAPEPRLLLLDEPMSALDARLRERLRVQVREIQRELGITTVYVTHDQEEALSVSDRVAVVDGGRIEQVGRPRELYDAPATRFVAEFLGDNNVFAGSVVAGGDRVRDAAAARDDGGDPLRLRVDGGGTLPLPSDVAEDARDGDRLVVCVRPERIRVHASGDGDREGERAGDRVGGNGGTGRGTGADPDGALLATTVESTEFLGDATRLHCDWNGVAVTVRTDGSRSFDVGEPVTLGVDRADVRVVERS
ncbi:ATP-binding cassette domain-containing protein [Halobaculum sp. WSA2]|uniref:Molybdate/tungstate import ATP-binding protein WtpC n=1 Tax=Halobaculum saliterrae TaxID=2073113 RepID=A0A6B0SUH7_9EURY|nr:ATP-binding cassette domain-containing protein [Halobaculum saliterrae]